MNRYRDPSSPPRDDNALQEGDISLLGVNSYDSPENLQPGQCQAAVNTDFTTQDAVTRGGFVCDPNLGTSPFGNNWTASTAAAANDWTGVAYGANLYVAVSNNGASRVMYSPDGVTWTSASAAAANTWATIAFGAGLFVAVSGSGVGNRVMTSPDGVTWTSRTSAEDNTWTAICYAPSIALFVAVASDGTHRVMTSPDGITWTARTAASAYTWSSVTFGAGLFVAVANDTLTHAGVMTSPDGITWTARTTVPNDRGWQGVTYGNGLFVAIDGSVITDYSMYSADGITWTATTNIAPNPVKGAAIAYGNGNFMTVGNARSFYSGDAISWLAHVATTGSAIVHGPDRFVTVGAAGIAAVFLDTQVWASGLYSAPSEPGSQWTMLVGTNTVGFYAFGKTPHTILMDSGLTVSQPSTIVQCNNYVYIFRGSSSTPLYWDGNWSGTFALAPTPSPGTGFQIIPNSNQATFYQNRLWVIQGKDDVAASDVLDFTTFDLLANDFNVNTGDSNFLVTTYPFGTTTLVVFKNKSIIALTAVDGALTDVVATEITRQVGCTGINAVVSVGSDLVYMSDRNINLLSLTATSNALQHQTLPLSRNIRTILRRVNWDAADKVSMAYWDNKLYVALPLDNATSCNTVVVYNFVTEQWFGEWNFSAAMNVKIQGWVTSQCFGESRLQCITEDGRILITNEGQNDISGYIVSEISTSLTTRAYAMNNENRFNRRLFLDLGTNRPSYSVTAYVDGASESSVEVTNQTYSRSEGWMFNESTYTLTNANDDYNRAYRKDYATGPGTDATDGIQCGSGFQPQMLQQFRLPIITRQNGRLTWLTITNTQGYLDVLGVGFEARAGYRSSLIQVG